MTLAMLFHLVRGEASVIWMHTLLAALALFVAWGRWRPRRPTAASIVSAAEPDPRDLKGHDAPVLDDRRDDVRAPQ